MHKILNILLIAFLSWSFTSCADDIIFSGNEEEGKNPSLEETEGDFLNVYLEDAGIRTRNVAFGEGTPVRINTVWLGVFDLETGNLVTFQEITMGYAFLTSGTEESGVIRHKLTPPSSNTAESFFMVALVNYSGVYGWKNVDASEMRLVSDLLGEVKTWNEFNAIGIDTQSAYYEGEDDDTGHSSDAPLMAGFLNASSNADLNPKEMHVKVDQFNTDQDRVIPLFPTSAETSIKFGLTSDKKKFDFYDKDSQRNKMLFLRRLVSNINVNIYPDKDKVAVTNVSFKRYNVPKSVYIIERRMLNNSGSFPSVEEASLSPNFADSNPSEFYESDQYWNETANMSSTNSDETSVYNSTSKWTFSIQHFANKHWARHNLEKYSEREGVVFDGTGDDRIPYFTALCASSTSSASSEENVTVDKEDFNNYASYIVLRLAITDLQRNRCGEIDYIIHEGYTSDADGLASNVTGTKLKDFSCARNVNYTYNIVVKGIDNIYYNVYRGTEDESGSTEVFENLDKVSEHRPDIQGKVWNMNYAGEQKYDDGSSNFRYILPNTDYQHGNFTNFLPWNGGDEQEELDGKAGGVYKNFIKFDSNKPDIAFRVYGYNSKSNAEDRVEGYNYNFPDESFKYLNNMWPPSVGNKSHYFRNYDAMVLDYISQVKENGQTVGQINTQLFYTFMFRPNEDLNIEEEWTDESEHQMEFKNGILKGSEDLRDDNGNVTHNDFVIPFKKDTWISITQLIQAIHHLDGKFKLPAFDLRVTTRELTEGSYNPEREMDYVRALYIGDRNGKPDNDECSRRVNIFAAVQGIKKE